MGPEDKKESVEVKKDIQKLKRAKDLIEEVLTNGYVEGTLITRALEESLSDLEDVIYVYEKYGK